jgi:hypothetical protein
MKSISGYIYVPYMHLRHDVRQKCHFLCGFDTVSYEFLFTTLQCKSNVDVWLRIRRHYVDLIHLNAEERKEGKWEQGLVRDTAFISRQLVRQFLLVLLHRWGALWRSG